MVPKNAICPPTEIRIKNSKTASKILGLIRQKNYFTWIKFGYEPTESEHQSVMVHVQKSDVRLFFS